MNRDIEKKLKDFFKPEELEWRVQSCGISNGKPWAMVLCYIQARAVQNRLDEVFGWNGWQDTYKNENNNCKCNLSVRDPNNIEWISKENGASETKIESYKGGISDSFKRVAASGYGIGRYLYNLDTVFAVCQTERPKDKKSWKQAKKDGKCIYWQIPNLPQEFLPTKMEKK